MIRRLLRRLRPPALSVSVGLCIWGTVAAAELCPTAPMARPGGFPNQPLNILIPRSIASGALPLSQEMAAAIAGLTDAQGQPLGIEVNLLFKADGELDAALEYFESLPPNGYNIIQLNDTYASLLAQQPDRAQGLVPLAMSQITPSQIYIRTDNPDYSSLEEFRAYVLSAETPTQVIAKFGQGGGLEDFLIAHFMDANGVREKNAPETATSGEGSATADPPALPAPLKPEPFESGSKRYFSMFLDPDDSERSDVLIEQPGDIARLLEGGLLQPIYTLLPERDVTDTLRDRLGGSAAFRDDAITQCAIYLRYRGFFVSRALPEHRRQFLEWLFLQAFNSAGFQDFNRALYMDVLYDNPSVIAGYCSAEAAGNLFQESVRLYRDCLASSVGQRVQAAAPGGGQ